jgi:hypothetical protein
MSVTDLGEIDIIEFPMGEPRPHADVGERAKRMLAAFDYQNGRQFAIDAGISYATWNRIENGWQLVSHSVWLKIARKCPGMSRDYLNYGDMRSLDPTLRKALQRAP